MIGQKGIPASYGGVEHHVHCLAIELKNAGHDVTIYSRPWYAQHRENTYDGIHIVSLPSLHTKHLDTITHTFLATAHALFQTYDVIHYHGVGPSLLSWIPKIFLRKTKIVTTFHSIDRYHEKWNWAARLMLRLGEWTACRFAHVTITISQSLEIYCAREFQKETAYISLGVSSFKTESLFPDLLKPFGLQKDSYLLMVSRLVPHKGAHFLIDAFVNIKKRFELEKNTKRKDLKLVIVGGSVFTNTYVRELHLQASGCNDIIFTDFQTGKTLYALYQYASALVHPSASEGMPLSVLEAMAHGKPVLLSRIPEHMELITNQDMFFDEKNVSSLEETLWRFLHLPVETQKQWGEENRRVVEKRHDWSQILPQILTVYDSQPHSLSHHNNILFPVKINITDTNIKS